MREDAALARWCENLPRLREEAARTGAAARLDREIARVRDGGSAVSACRKWLDTEPAGGVRSWAEPPGAAIAGLPGSPPVTSVGAGAYRCPRQRCSRTAGRDEHGHVPGCAAFGVPMVPGR
ncbi:hypothetical protein [Amycolatopsis sacchari]|uniref:Uncharacterized protein n=1 Tax=Amycolatopsis sacchari TaxID=115433 RepID=A0A1I3QBF6_9PSEU|nr:hypothetical protein [Amycolatopsis sacchari]SFJ30882.1 hypothetical protein SAMN05421835_104249 [Amycolatopsis sacchari]